MSKVISIFLSTVLLTGLAVGGYYLYQNQEPPKPPSHHIILLDRSASLPPDPECTALPGLVDEIFSSPGITNGSTLSLMVTGGQDTLYEPAIVATVEIPVNASLVENREAIHNQYRALTMELQARCRRHNKQVKESALYLGISRGLQQLRSLNCGLDTQCRLLVKSDGRENQDIWFRNSVAKGEVLERTSSKLENQLVKVTICGLANTLAIGGDKKTKKNKAKDRVAIARLYDELWLQSFTHARNVDLRPVCPGTVDACLVR